MTTYFRYSIHIIILAIIYFAGAVFGSFLSIDYTDTAPLWPPPGIALAALLLYGYRLWPGITLGALLFSVYQHETGLAMFGGAFSHTLQALVGYYALTYWVDFRPTLERVRDVFSLAVIGALVSTMIDATVDTALIMIDDSFSLPQFAANWSAWWLDETMGVLIVTPVLLTWGSMPHERLSREKLLEGLALLATLFLTSVLSFVITGLARNYPLAYLPFPLLIWAAFRFDQRGASLTALIVSCFAAWGTVHKRGFFVLENLSSSSFTNQAYPSLESLFLLWGFVIVLGFTGLIVAAIVSERQQAQQHLITEKAFTDHAIDSLPGIFYLCDVNGKMLRWNANLPHVSGYSPEEVASMRVTDFFDVEDQYLLMKKRQEVLRRGQADVEAHMATKGNNKIPFLFTGRHVTLNGSPFLVGTGLDLTQLKQTEHALFQSLETFRLLIESVEEYAIYMLDFHGYIISWNAGAERIKGYTTEEILGCHYAGFFTQEDQEAGKPAQFIEEARVHGSHTTEGIRVRKDGSTFIAHAVISAIYGEDGTHWGYAKVTRDITELKQYEEQLIAAKEKAEEMNELKSAFLTNMSHEIRTPLTAIIGFADILSKEIPSQKRELTDYISQSGRRLLNTLNSVLDLSMLESRSLELNISTLDVLAEVKENIEILRPLASMKQLPLHLQIDCDHAFAELDESCLGRIMNNLVGNAIKFTEEGHVSVAVHADDQNVYIEIQDTGIGIKPEFIPYIFDEFKQESVGTTRTHEGTGLGLAITKRLVDLLKGTITVTSIPDTGSTFTVSFPLASPPQSIAAAVPTHSFSSSNQTGIHLLIVEDNPETASLLEWILQPSYAISVAYDARSSLELAQSHKFDLIMLDINLGDNLSGIDVLRHLRGLSSYAHTPIVAITAYALPGDRNKLLELGFDGYLSKPFTAQQLFDIIDQFKA